MKNFGTERGTEGARATEIMLINQMGVGFGLFSLPLRQSFSDFETVPLGTPKTPQTGGFGARLPSPFSVTAIFLAHFGAASLFGICNSSLIAIFPVPGRFTGNFRKRSGNASDGPDKSPVFSGRCAQIPQTQNRELCRPKQGRI